MEAKEVEENEKVEFNCLLYWDFARKNKGKKILVYEESIDEAPDEDDFVVAVIPEEINSKSYEAFINKVQSELEEKLYEKTCNC